MFFGVSELFIQTVGNEAEVVCVRNLFICIESVASQK